MKQNDSDVNIEEKQKVSIQIAENLNSILADRELKPADLWRALKSEGYDYSPQYVGKLVRGESKFSAELLFQISKALKISIDQFFNRTEIKENPRDLLSRAAEGLTGRRPSAREVEQIEQIIRLWMER